MICTSTVVYCDDNEIADKSHGQHCEPHDSLHGLCRSTALSQNLGMSALFFLLASQLMSTHERLLLHEFQAHPSPVIQSYIPAYNKHVLRDEEVVGSAQCSYTPPPVFQAWKQHRTCPLLHKPTCRAAGQTEIAQTAFTLHSWPTVTSNTSPKTRSRPLRRTRC